MARPEETIAAIAVQATVAMLFFAAVVAAVGYVVGG